MNATAPSSPGSKEKILARVREALRVPAPQRHLAAGSHTPASATCDLPDSAREWLPPVPDDFEGRVRLFSAISAELTTCFLRCPTISAAAGELSRIAAGESWQRLAAHRHPLIEEVLSGANLPAPLLVDGGYDKAQLERCDAGISTCEALAAQTGSILVSSISSGGRALSVLPPHHIVLATAPQMVRDLQSAFDVLRANHDESLPRYFSIITGPSRTGDIERILVLGAHGPKKLTVLLIG